MKASYNDFFNRVLENVAVKISSIRCLDSKKLRCAALIYTEKKHYHILCNQDLSEEEKLFVLTHEVGHIVLDKMFSDPYKCSSKESEREVNLWTLEKLKPYIKSEFYPHLRKAFQVSEKSGFNLIKKKFKNNLYKEEEYNE